MRKKKLCISLIIMIFIIITFIGMFLSKTEPKSINYEKKPNVEENIKSDSKSIQFLKSISDIEAINTKLIDNPVGIKGEFLVPEKSIVQGVNYFLIETKNDKITNLNINIEDGKIKAKVDYRLTKNINVPVEVEVLPTLNKNKDLVLNIKNVKLLDLKLYDWIVDLSVNSFIKDWFSKDSNILVKFNDGSVIIDKTNFKGVNLENINLDKHNLKLNMIINLKYFLNK